MIKLKDILLEAHEDKKLKRPLKEIDTAEKTLSKVIKALGAARINMPHGEDHYDKIGRALDNVTKLTDQASEELDKVYTETKAEYRRTPLNPSFAGYHGIGGSTK